MLNVVYLSTKPKEDSNLSSMLAQKGCFSRDMFNHRKVEVKRVSNFITESLSAYTNSPPIVLQLQQFIASLSARKTHPNTRYKHTKQSTYPLHGLPQSCGSLTQRNLHPNRYTFSTNSTPYSWMPLPQLLSCTFFLLL